MATYNSDQYAAAAPIAGHGLSGNTKVAYFSVTCAAAPSTADTINFGYLPAGARVVMAVLEATDMDTGSAALTINVGDAGSATRLFSASTVAQAGTLSQALAVTGNDYLYTAKTLITGVAGTNATTPAAGTLYLTVFYTVEGQAS